MLQWTLVGGAALVSWLLTGRVRRYALASALFDVPNERSAHARPIPRGGGLAIVVVTVAGGVAAVVLGWIAPAIGLALAGGLPVALIGWLDDRRSQPASRRALVQTVAAVWAVWLLGGLPALKVGESIVPLGAAGAMLAVISIVAATNFFNFMDGIDGLAAGEALVAGGVGGALLWVSGNSGLGFVSLVIAAASAGFLVWNWSPARIFMGDIGSGFLGFVIAVLALASERSGALPLLLWALILGVFIFDALLTVLRRVAFGEQWHGAHRSHAYQRAVQSGMSHAGVASLSIFTTLVLGGLAALGVWRSALVGVVAVAGVILLSVIYLAVERRRPMSRTDDGRP